MKNKRRVLQKVFALAMLSGISSQLFAAAGTDPIRGNAKFNVVVIVIGIIFTGIVFFLFRMDRRLTNLEKNQNSKK